MQPKMTLKIINKMTKNCLQKIFCLFFFSYGRFNRVRNSVLVFGFSLNSPSMQDVTVLLVVFWTPLMTWNQNKKVIFVYIYKRVCLPCTCEPLRKQPRLQQDLQRTWQRWRFLSSFFLEPVIFWSRFPRSWPALTVPALYPWASNQY